jgi:MFS family permease
VSATHIRRLAGNDETWPSIDRARCTSYLDLRVTKRHHPAPHRLAYFVLVAVFAVGRLGTTVPTPLYVLWQELYRFPTVIITFLFALFTVGMVAALLCLGRISDHFGRRPVLLGALGVAGASTVLFLLAQYVSQLLVGRLLSGLAVGLLIGAAPAGLAELQPAGNQAQAGRLATTTDLGSLGLGAFMAGLFAQFAPAPTRLLFIVYLALLAVAVLLVRKLPEPVASPDRVLDLRPRLRITPAAHAIFWPAAVTAFCLSALLGLFSALTPSLLRSSFHVPNLALAGGVVGALYGAAAIANLVLHSLTSRHARLAGVLLLLAGLAFIEVGLALSNFVCFLTGTLLGGVGAGLAYMGCLAAINQVAPADHKAEFVSAYFVVSSLSSLAVVGVGAVAQRTSLFVASLFLAALMAVLLLLTLAAVLWLTRRRRSGCG